MWPKAEWRVPDDRKVEADIRLRNAPQQIATQPRVQRARCQLEDRRFPQTSAEPPVYTTFFHCLCMGAAVARHLVHHNRRLRDVEARAAVFLWPVRRPASRGELPRRVCPSASANYFAQDPPRSIASFHRSRARRSGSFYLPAPPLDEQTVTGTSRARRTAVTADGAAFGGTTLRTRLCTKLPRRSMTLVVSIASSTNFLRL